MLLTPGARLGAYEILGSIGAGGMGEVWRARDTKLNREVAIKVLPAALAGDAQYMARFEREAQTLAALNHPNVATVYGVEQDALVMEFVEGADLKGPLPVDEAIAIARQIANGLEAAHERGVIHRDLKPANIKVTPAGVVKILDFGLAKTVEASAAAANTVSPTLSLAMTQAGAILGTAAYMSPEQARGKPVDRRADIWAFGVVFYEMLTGESLFHGETVSDIVAGVLRADIDLGRLPAETPDNVRRLLQRCLERDPKRRLTDIGMVRLELDHPLPVARAVEAAAPVRRVSWLPWAVAAVSVTAAGVAVWRGMRPAPLLPLVRLSAEAGVEGGLTFADGGSLLNFSPDGTRVAFVFADSAGKRHLAVRQLAQDQATVLGAGVGVQSPFFSPDGTWLGFYSDGILKKVAVAGGTPITLTTSVPRPSGAHWAEPNAIYASVQDVIVRIPAGGGPLQRIVQPAPGETYQRWPHYLPQHQMLLFASGTGALQNDAGDIVAVSLRTGKRSVLAHGHSPRYIPGFLLFQSNVTIFAAPFDPAAGTLLGEPVPLVNDAPIGPLFNGLYSVSAGGDLVYPSLQAGRAGSRYVRLDEKTNQREVLRIDQGQALHPRLSPDGRRLAVDMSVSGTSSDIWIKDLDRDTFSRLTFLEGNSRYPVWTPDGKAIVFQNYTTKPAIYWAPADGSAPPVRLYDGLGYPWSISPDGKRLAMHLRTNTAPLNIATAAIEGDATNPRLGKPEPVAPSPAQQVDASFSPDGRWLAYTSQESGVGQVYVRAYPGPSGRWQISSDGGSSAVWSRRSQELFYSAPGGVMAMPYSVVGGQFVPGKARLFTKQRPLSGSSFTWDVTPDGKQIVMLLGAGSNPDDASAHQLTFLFHFLDEVRRRTGR